MKKSLCSIPVALLFALTAAAPSALAVSYGSQPQSVTTTSDTPTPSEAPTPSLAPTVRPAAVATPTATPASAASTNTISPWVVLLLGALIGAALLSLAEVSALSYQKKHRK